MKLEIDLLSTVTVSQSVNRKSVPPPIAASNEQENRSNEAPVVHNLSLSKKGFLLKRGGKNMSKWQKRYFELVYSVENKMYSLTYKQKEKVYFNIIN